MCRILTYLPGIPHFLTQDDQYNGYHIPKGSVIHPLEWYVVDVFFNLFQVYDLRLHTLARVRSHPVENRPQRSYKMLI